MHSYIENTACPVAAREHVGISPYIVATPLSPPSNSQVAKQECGHSHMQECLHTATGADLHC